MQINYIRGTERVTVDHENKTVTVQRLDETEATPTDYAVFVSVKDSFRDNDNPYMSGTTLALLMSPSRFVPKPNRIKLTTIYFLIQNKAISFR